ncbi:hypothetical protein ABT131_37335 [Streptomyces sp900105245]|uniref:hypothetical protein n=1 Tax=Streptomyces sp. 900105245 TaxID=3154379 RepID=UPI003324F9CD
MSAVFAALIALAIRINQHPPKVPPPPERPHNSWLDQWILDVSQHAANNPMLFAAIIFALVLCFGHIFRPRPYSKQSIEEVARPSPVRAMTRKYNVASRNSLVGHIFEATLWADRLYSQGFSYRAYNIYRMLSETKIVKRQIRRRYLVAGLLPFSGRSRRLRRHARLVVAAVENAEAKLDEAPLEALTSLVNLLMEIAARHTQGLNGALLPVEDLEGLTPAPDWEPVRMVLAALFMGGAAVAVSLFKMPDPAITTLLGAAGVLIASILYGRRVLEKAGDIVNLMRG